MTKSIKTPVVIACGATLTDATLTAMSKLAVKMADFDILTISEFIEDFAGLCTTIGCKDDYDQLRDHFIVAYMNRQLCSDKSAANRWSEMYRATGLPKPQSTASARKQELRKAKKAADTANVKGANTDEPSAPLEGASIAKGAMVELSKIELHIINLIRAKKFEMAAQCIADQADNT
jgi:hypothetical protein